MNYSSYTRDYFWLLNCVCVWILKQRRPVQREREQYTCRYIMIHTWTKMWSLLYILRILFNALKTFLSSKCTELRTTRSMMKYYWYIPLEHYNSIMSTIRTFHKLTERGLGKRAIRNKVLFFAGMINWRLIVFFFLYGAVHLQCTTHTQCITH